MIGRGGCALLLLNDQALENERSVDLVAYRRSPGASDSECFQIYETVSGTRFTLDPVDGVAHFGKDTRLYAERGTCCGVQLIELSFAGSACAFHEPVEVPSSSTSEHKQSRSSSSSSTTSSHTKRTQTSSSKTSPRAKHKRTSSSSSGASPCDSKSEAFACQKRARSRDERHDSRADSSSEKH